MAKQNEKQTNRKPPVETNLLFTVLADQFYTLLIVAFGAAVLTGWIMRDSLSAGREIQPHMYVILVVTAAVVAGLAGVYLLRREALEQVWQRSRAATEARLLLKEVRRGKRRYASLLKVAQIDTLNAAEDHLNEVLEARDWERLTEALNKLDAELQQHLGFARKSTAREYVESIGIAVLIALFLRSFVVEAFRIPSGSMIPTLQVGDQIFVNKFIYGVRIPFTDYKIGMDLRKPERGEVIVFKWPRDPEKDFIKRVIGVEGDTINIQKNVLYINGQPVERMPGERPCEYEDRDDETSERWVHRFCEKYVEKLGNHLYSPIYNPGGQQNAFFDEVKVPPGHVFVMGDNRDNSNDSRSWGFVPVEYIKGKAIVIWWSSGQPEGIRVKRMGQLVE